MFHKEIRHLREMDMTLFQRHRFSPQMAWKKSLHSCRCELLESVKQIMKIMDEDNGSMAQFPFLIVAYRSYIHAIFSNQKVR